MKKKLVAVLLAATMSLGLLAGCGGSGGATSGDAASSGSSSEAGASGEVDTSKEVELVMYVISEVTDRQDRILWMRI